MSRSLISLFFTSIFAVVLLSIFAGPSRAQGGGEALYKSKCVACHGADGKGATATGKSLGARDLGSSEVQAQSDEQLVEAITKGKGKMPAYGKTLKDEQIKDLVSYVRGLVKKT